LYLGSLEKRVLLERVFNPKQESINMGRCTKTVGERRLGRTIYKLGNSVELSSKEGKAKVAEQKYKQENKATQGLSEDSPVENLRDPASWKKKQTQ
jgi:hypothetical protein